MKSIIHSSSSWGSAENWSKASGWFLTWMVKDVNGPSNFGGNDQIHFHDNSMLNFIDPKPAIRSQGCMVNTPAFSHPTIHQAANWFSLVLDLGCILVFVMIHIVQAYITSDMCSTIVNTETIAPWPLHRWYGVCILPSACLNIHCSWRDHNNQIIWIYNSSSILNPTTVPHSPRIPRQWSSSASCCCFCSDTN